MTADRALVAAMAKGDTRAVAAMVDGDFSYVDINGRFLNKLQFEGRLPQSPLGDEAGLAPAAYQYGEVAHVSVARDKVFILRIWVKRADGWRLMVWHEVSQNLAPAPHGPGKKEWDNPCYSLPYAPKTQDERDCLTAWQQLEIAVMHHEPDVWASHVADEFMVAGAARRHSKADRKAVLEEQRRTDANSAPAPLVAARMYGFPQAMVMSCEHQPFHGKLNRVSRVFVKRDCKWLMAVSFQTAAQDAPVVTI
jgi:hypothetical protein